MTPPRFAFIKAKWHADIVDQALVGRVDQADVVFVLLPFIGEGPVRNV